MAGRLYSNENSEAGSSAVGVYFPGRVLSDSQIEDLCGSMGIEHRFGFKASRGADGRIYMMTDHGIYDINPEYPDSYNYFNFDLDWSCFKAHRIRDVSAADDPYPRFMFVTNHGSEEEINVTTLHLYDVRAQDDFWVRQKTKNSSRHSRTVHNQLSPNLNFGVNEKTRKFLENKARLLGFFKETEDIKQAIYNTDITTIHKYWSIENPKIKFYSFCALILLFIGFFFFANRESLFFNLYVDSIANEAECLNRYIYSRDSDDKRAYWVAIRKRLFFETILGVGNRGTYLLNRGYVLHGGWTEYGLPATEDPKEMYGKATNFIGRVMIRASYSIRYQNPCFIIEVSLNGKIMNLYVTINEHSMNWANNNFNSSPVYPEEVEKGKKFWINQFYRELQYKFRRLRHYGYGRLLIVECAMDDNSLGGLYRGDEIWIIVSRKMINRKLKQQGYATEEDRCHLSEKFKKSLEDIFLDLMREGEPLRILKHEAGHSVQYALRLRSAWEYIARYFEKLQHRVEIQ